VTVSAGVATVAPDQGARFEALLALVEARLEQASSAGGDQAIGD
jgi:PleD family two-component response regulator